MKIGDRVKIVNTGKMYTTYEEKARELKATKWGARSEVKEGDFGIITGIDSEGFVLVDLGSVEILIGIKGLIKVNNKIGGMMEITNLMRKILDKDIRTVMKAGYIDEDLTLTQKGENELMGILFLEKKAELVKMAEEELKENKELK